MIVCTGCGTNNEDTDDFCGNCGSFLEFSGERVTTAQVTPPGAETEPEDEEESPTFVERAKAAIGIDTSRATDEPAAVVAADPSASTEAVDDARPLEGSADASSADSRGTTDTGAVDEAEEVRLRAEAEALRQADEKAQLAEEARRAAEEAAQSAEEERGRVREAEEQLQAERAARVEAERGAAAARAEAQRVAEAARAEAAELAEASATKSAEEVREAREAAESEAEAAAARQAVEADARVEAERVAREEAERARREAEEHVRAAEAARAEAEQRAKEAEQAARMAALVAKPKVVEEPATQPPPGDGRAADSSVSDRADTSGAPGRDLTKARKPERVKPKRRKAETAPATEVVNPGDLICGECGAGNDPTRKFCRRCGHTLADAPAAPSPPWYRRLFRRRARAKPPAGTRPGRGGGRRPGVKSRGQYAARGVKSKLGKVGRILALLGLLGIAALSIGPWRGAIGDGFDRVKRIFVAEFDPVRPGAVAASSELPDHPAVAAIDQIRNSYWAEAAEGNGEGQGLTFTFEGPTDIDKVGFHNGALERPEDFVTQPRVRELQLLFDDGTTELIELDDSADFQSFSIKARGVQTVQLQIVSVYPSLEGSAASLAEVEFFTKK